MEEVINETFKSINELSLKYLFDQAFKKLYAIDKLIKKMQKYSSDSSKLDCMPSRDSFTDFYSKMIKLIKDNKSKISDSFRQVL